MANQIHQQEIICVFMKHFLESGNLAWQGDYCNLAPGFQFLVYVLIYIGCGTEYILGVFEILDGFCVIRQLQPDFDTFTESADFLTVGEGGFVVKSTGDKVEIPDAAVRHGYDIQVLNGEDVLDLGTFTVTDDLTITLSYKYTLFSVDFIVDGEVYKHYDLFYNDPITLPESPTKETDAQYIYSFKEWEGYTEGMVVSDNAKFTAVFNETLREYTVQFYSKDELIRTDVMKYGETIVPPADLDGYTEDGIDFIFIGWSGYTSGDTVKGNISYQAMFIEKDHEYTIQFLVDGKVFYESKQTYETPIVPPEENPTKETADGIQYTFAGWEGYEEGMIVTDDVTFTAVFNQSPVDDGSGSTWIIVAVVVIIAILVALFLYKKFH